MGFTNWWDQTVVPRIVRCGCSQESIMALRRDVVPLARGAVFELGCGGGLNQPLYDPSQITSFAGLDPSRKLLEDARSEAANKGWRVQRVIATPPVIYQPASRSPAFSLAAD